MRFLKSQSPDPEVNWTRRSVFVVQHETNDGEMNDGTDNWTLAPPLELHGADVLLRKTASDAFLRTGLKEAPCRSSAR